MAKKFFSIKEEGFTLIEVLVSIAILGIISISVLAFFTQSYDYTKKNESKTVGINVARNVINYFDQLNYDELYSQYHFDKPGDISAFLTADDCKSRPSFYTSSCSAILEPTINNVDYKTEITLSRYTNENDHADFMKQNLIRIEVKVIWKDKETKVEGLLKK